VREEVGEAERGEGKLGDASSRLGRMRISTVGVAALDTRREEKVEELKQGSKRRTAVS
jgi:hypothetical protein